MNCLMKKFTKLIIYLSFLVPLKAQAQVTDDDWKDIFDINRFFSPDVEIKVILLNLLTLLFTLATIYAIVFTGLNGYKMITAGGNEEKYTEAKKGLVYGAVGIVITVLAVVIAQTVVNIASNPGSL